MDKENILYKIVSQIPVGRVSTYGILAKATGIKNPRLVGKYLHGNPDPKNIPCYRVVSAKGFVANKYAFGGAKLQMKKLTEEGLEIKVSRVDLSKYLWKPV